MSLTKLIALRAVSLALCCLTPSLSAAPPATRPSAYRNFKVAMYVPISVTMQMKDPQWLQHSFDRLSSQVRFDKVYIENYRGRRFADDETLETVKKFFTDHGIEASGGVAFDAGSINGQFVSPCYTDDADRAMVKRASEQAAKHFDEVILDDFFFVTTKNESDIKAKGDQSWTEFRLKLMNDVAKNLVVGPAKAVNPNVKVIIKYPNWYEHFAGSGYDLKDEPKTFDAIYTGTETRDPMFSEQHLQAYESYQIIRYFDHIAPGKNLGGWVDPYDQKYSDRYAEQLWDTLLAKTPEITLFNWVSLLEPLNPGDRSPWQQQRTTLDSAQLTRRGPATRDSLPANPEIARVAGLALDVIDPIVGQLGEPIGIASYRPPHAIGEDFLHNFLGMVGIPIEMSAEFPGNAKGGGPQTILLTESAKFDADIVSKIKTQLMAGDNVVITSGLLHALQHTGKAGERIEDICEVEVTDQKATVTQFQGPGGRLLSSATLSPGITIPQVRFLTNDAWGLVMGVANSNGFPILISDRYGKGELFVLTMPDNFTDLYQLPPEALAAIRRTILRHFPIRLDAPAQVSLFAYDNRTFVAESFLPMATTATATIVGKGRLRDLSSGETLTGVGVAASRGRDAANEQTVFTIPLNAHSLRAFKIEDADDSKSDRSN